MKTEFVREYFEEFGMYDIIIYRKNGIDMSVLVFEPSNPSGQHLHTDSYEVLTFVDGNVQLNGKAMPSQYIVDSFESHNIINILDTEEAIVISQMIPDHDSRDLLILEDIEENEK